MKAGSIFALVACFCTFTLVSPAGAGTLAPGQTRSGNTEGDNVFPLPDTAVWQGAVLAERTQSYEFSAVTEDERQLFSRGTFTSRVHRDRETGGLAFVYEFDETENVGGDVRDFEQSSLGGFAGFDVDFYFSRDEFRVIRSADGATLTIQPNLEVVEGTFLVRTDAEDFDENGSFVVNMDFEGSGESDSETFATFQPADNGGPGPNPIPLPPAAWAALATVAAFGGVRRVRRRVGRSPR
jgi:hypothetical protein